MKLPVLLLCLVGLAPSLPAADPAFDWVFSGGGEKNDKTRGVAVDRAGGVFLTGETIGDGRFGRLERKGLGEADCFLVKLDAAGEVLWVRSIGGSSVDRGYSVATDPAGHVYVTGQYQSTDARAGETVLPNAGDFDLFVAKYDADGELLWIRTAGGTGNDYGHGVAVDSRGHVVVGGSLGAGARFGDVELSGKRVIFCAKYDADGKLLWVRGSEGGVGGSAHGVSLDGGDRIYLGGSLVGTGTFGGVEAASANSAAMVAKLDPDGAVQWVATAPASTSSVYHEIVADSSGRVWAAGMFKGETGYGDETFRSAGERDYDGLLVHYDTDGTMRWARHLGSAGTDYGLGVCTDDRGTAFLAGEFSQSATFAGRTLTSRGGTDILTAAFDVGGGLLWVAQSGGAKGDNAYTIARHEDRLLIAGACTAPAAFGGKSVEKGGAAELYAAKLRIP